MAHSEKCKSLGFIRVPSAFIQDWEPNSSVLKILAAPLEAIPASSCVGNLTQYCQLHQLHIIVTYGVEVVIADDL